VGANVRLLHSTKRDFFPAQQQSQAYKISIKFLTRIITRIIIKSVGEEAGEMLKRYSSRELLQMLNQYLNKQAGNNRPAWKEEIRMKDRYIVSSCI
jgi:hypothetical protein